MKHTSKILIALIITLTFLMAFVTIPASAEATDGGENAGETTTDNNPAPDEAPATDDTPSTDDAPATDDAPEADGEGDDQYQATYAICIAILGIALAFSIVSLVRKPKVKPWWMI